MKKLRKQAKELLHAASKVYHYRRDVTSEARLQELEKSAREVGFGLNATQTGIVPVPLGPDGNPLSGEDFARLPDEERDAKTKQAESVQEEIQATLRDIRRIDAEARTAQSVLLLPLLAQSHRQPITRLPTARPVCLSDVASSAPVGPCPTAKHRSAIDRWGHQRSKFP